MGKWLPLREFERFFISGHKNIASLSVFLLENSPPIPDEQKAQRIKFRKPEQKPVNVIGLGSFDKKMIILNFFKYLPLEQFILP